MSKEISDKVILKSTFSLHVLLGFILAMVVINVVGGIITALLALIPFVGWILAIVSGIGLFCADVSEIFSFIGELLSTATMVEDGVYGRTKKLKKFKLSFDEIKSLSDDSGSIIIRTTIPSKKSKNGFVTYKAENVGNSEEFMKTFEKITGKCSH